jgi:hypothetical protein
VLEEDLVRGGVGAELDDLDPDFRAGEHLILEHAGDVGLKVSEGSGGQEKEKGGRGETK